MKLWHNMMMARETLKVLRSRVYCLDGKEVALPDIDFEDAIMCGGTEPSTMPDGTECPPGTIKSRLEVVRQDSFDAAQGMSKPLVLNFANAHCPGGGFKLGASSQEESLCRRSSLYLSLRSAGAAKMYRSNNLHLRPLESNWMVLSPSVCVFRDSGGRLLRQPYVVSVISVPAPNLRGLGFFASRHSVRAGLLTKIRIMLAEAHRHQYRELVLGAWGCGAFGNNPEMVAECFRLELLAHGWIRHFDKIVFAIKENPRSRNYAQFNNVLMGPLMKNGN
jgi:uncharacterized protein (TIGR02452 family)